MKHNPKVVNFNRSSAFAYHRAMINRRENNPLDALELLRSAAEHSPENAEYRLQLARQYAEIGWYEESCRLVLDVLSEADAPADAYLLLADSLISIGRSDAAEALMLLCQKGVRGQAYNVAGRWVHSIREYAETLARLAGVKVVFENPDDAEKAGYSRVNRAVLDPSKIEKLGFESRTSLEQGLTEMLNICRNNAMGW